MSKIVVMGDICVDVNYHGEVNRISPEAPVPIFEIKSIDERPGMAGNVVKNLQRTGTNTVLLSKEQLYLPITKKSRYFSKGLYLYRIDKDEKEPLNNVQQEMMIEKLVREIKHADGLLLQDYNKGFFDNGFIAEVIKVARKTKPSITIMADGNKGRGSDFYLGIDYLKLNEEETNALGHPHPASFGWKGRITTLGEEGSYLFTADDEQYRYKEAAKKVVDVTGAGDTFVAWFLAEYIRLKDEKLATYVATVASAISVEHLGCYAPSMEEVKERLA